jgi:hypothetical protein
MIYLLIVMIDKKDSPPIGRGGHKEYKMRNHTAINRMTVPESLTPVIKNLTVVVIDLQHYRLP